MKILILGGTGAMGKYLCNVLKQKHDVYVTSRGNNLSDTNVHYIKGNAKHLCFVQDLLKNKFDTIVDFMSYSTDEFLERYDLLLSATSQYVFLSSCRCYANSSKLLKEDSERLLEVCEDSDYLNTDEYALSKARQEDILLKCGANNWTIIRPYITYSENRLQLGAYEKELWLCRALRGKQIVFPVDIGQRVTSMTYGADVATILANIVCNDRALGEIYQIATEEYMAWDDILSIYAKTYEREMGRPLNYIRKGKSRNIASIQGNTYQLQYDRLFDRKFECSKVRNVCQLEQFEFSSTKETLSKCLSGYLEENKDNDFLHIDWKMEGVFDRITGDSTRLKGIPGWKNKVKYFFYRNTPYVNFIY